MSNELFQRLHLMGLSEPGDYKAGLMRGREKYYAYYYKDRIAVTWIKDKAWKGSAEHSYIMLKSIYNRISGDKYFIETPSGDMIYV